MSLTGFEKISKSLEVEETWMLFELYQANGIGRDPWKPAVLGGGTLFKKMNAGYARLLSKT